MCFSSAVSLSWTPPTCVRRVLRVETMLRTTSKAAMSADHCCKKPRIVPLTFQSHTSQEQRLSCKRTPSSPAAQAARTAVPVPLPLRKGLSKLYSFTDSPLVLRSGVEHNRARRPDTEQGFGTDTRRTTMAEGAAKSLYERLGGYNAIAAATDDLLRRVYSDPQIGSYWKGHSKDSLRTERQLVVDFLAAAFGGPVLYRGRDMKTSHEGLGISERDWQ